MGKANSLELDSPLGLVVMPGNLDPNKGVFTTPGPSQISGVEFSVYIHVQPEVIFSKHGKQNAPKQFWF